MKFGRNLPRNQVPEWSSSYINYKGLKKLIKTASAVYKLGKDVNLAEILFSLDRNLEDVDAFYNKKFGDASRRLKLLLERYGSSKQSLEELDQTEIEELMSALLELRGQLRKLQWFGEVNRRGFVKITKKLDKKVPNVCAQHKYIASKVDPKPFATNAALAEAVKTINDWLEVLGDTKGKDGTTPVQAAHTVKRTSSRSIINLPNGLLDIVDQAIRNDDVPILKEALAEVSFEPHDAGMQKSKTNPQLTKSLELDSERMRFLTPAESPLLGPERCEIPESTLLSINDESVTLLIYLLDKLLPHQRAALSSKDSYDRLPLHYAAEYGFVVVCEVVMKYMQTWGQFSVEHGIDAPEWQDKEGLAPLHLSVIGGHTLTTAALLRAENWQGSRDQKAAMRRDISKSSAVLALATKSNFAQIVQLLVNAGVDINWQDETGETALHVAARFGHDECAKALLSGTADQRADVELAENSFSWTPLHIACVDGHQSIVELLIAAGADIKRQDASGWTAREHAALRGHLKIADILLQASLERLSTGSDASSGTSSSSSHRVSSLEAVHSQSSSNSIPKAVEPVKSFGHRYLTNESLVLVSLGSMDMRKDLPAVKLDKIPMAQAHSTQLDTALSVIVTAKGAQVKLYFDIVPTYAGIQEHKVGRGVAILANMKQAIGLKRMNLQGDEMTSTMVIGHRGLGKNVSSNRSLQLGENTLQSFIAAANLGANYVEFDVQLTKDLVPVIYHDFLVSETGIDAPVHTLTLEQFLHVNDGTPRPSRPPSPPKEKDNPAFKVVRGADRQRSLSLGNAIPEDEMPERMKHTRDFKAKGYKANSRGNFIQAPFTTLEEMFLKLPENVGFNVEMKYPMLHESEEQEMDTYAVELNSFVDTVLTKVYDLCKKRKIIFSSFNPDICLLLSFKQPNMPVLFLTDAGTHKVGDIRASSLQEAIRFASRWNLLGIVSAAEPLCNSPRLVRVVKENGLVCVSYGSLNNDPLKVQVRNILLLVRLRR
ncbi:putative Glycerophosphodiester phosphodiesterase GDE1 [Glarea lozoyensis 74030]|uniref:Putative Glycerophosphodiester phosphodiesterase GDE1 n=1 Tax=Glarea lozoyensis (strain ATCC 74030 / MF5533) TaxID=1104152 RepID=H0EUV6_GLAL7|nr:putative Glycerophosphodiester phosphodiesterase GDE1 [Glarea lozoyensis 74030]